MKFLGTFILPGSTYYVLLEGKHYGRLLIGVKVDVVYIRETIHWIV